MSASRNPPQAAGPAGGAPPRGGGSRGLTIIIVLVLAGAGGYMWKQYRETGRIAGMDEEKSQELAGRLRGIRERGAELLEESKELFTRRKADLESYFEERDIKLPTREELAGKAEKYKEKLAAWRSSSGRKSAGDSGDEEEDEREGEEEKPRPPRVARRARSSRAASGTEPAASAEPSSGSEAEGELDPMVLARRELGLGFEHWEKAVPDSGMEQDQLRTARKHFTAARDYLQKAKEKLGDDPEIEDLITDCNRFIYDCMKRTVLDLH